MAIPESNFPEERDDESLALAQSYHVLSQTAAWKDLTTTLEELVGKAQQEHFSSREVEPLKIVEEKLRWQQRLLIQEALLQRVQSFLQLRDELIAELKENLNEQHADIVG